MVKYTKQENEDGSVIIIRENEDETVSYIPVADGNSDYQKYLEDTKTTWTEPVLTK